MLLTQSSYLIPTKWWCIISCMVRFKINFNSFWFGQLLLLLILMLLLMLYLIVLKISFFKQMSISNNKLTFILCMGHVLGGCVTVTDGDFAGYITIMNISLHNSIYQLWKVLSAHSLSSQIDALLVFTVMKRPFL